MNTNESSRMTSQINSATRIKHKIIFLGDQHVGKTCIIERFVYDVFTEKQHPTVGVDFLAKTLHIDDKNIRLQLWDTAGQERFRSLIPSYLRDATCAIIVFDVTRQESFNGIEKWIKDYKDNRGQDAPCVMVGNKIDLAQNRVVTEEQGKKKAQDNGMNYYEISAKTGENISGMFKLIAQQLQPVDNSMMQRSQNFQYDNNDEMSRQQQGNILENQYKKPNTQNQNINLQAQQLTNNPNNQNPANGVKQKQSKCC